VATTPQINSPDGSGQTELLEMTSNLRQHFFSGTVDLNTVDIQVSVNGGGFVTDPSLIDFNLPDFTFPNVATYPNGYTFRPGETTIDIRAIDILGAPSQPARIVLKYVTRNDLRTFISAPTGLSVKRHFDSVEIINVGNPEPEVIGYNYYASRESGGGSEGYYLINSDLVQTRFDQRTDLFDPIDDDPNAGTTQTFTFTNEAITLRTFVEQLDELGNSLGTVADVSMDMSELGEDAQITVKVVERQTNDFFRFTHQRGLEIPGTLNGEQFVDVEDTEPLYYVVTAVAYDSVSGEQVESAFSNEITALPITLDTNVQHLPARTQEEMSVSYIEAVQRVEEQLSLIPGSVARNVHINPFSSEASRLWFILDFMSRAGSFLTLLEIDDRENTGESSDPETDPYKIALAVALNITDPALVQVIIDSAFDQLASNYGVTRDGERNAIGTAIFYTSKRPVADLSAQAGDIIGNEDAVTFSVDASVDILSDNPDAYWNPVTKAYEVAASITATESGEDGNVSPGPMTVEAGAAGLSVRLDNPTEFGRAVESNRELAEKSILAFVSVDAGTEGGYRKTALATPGVERYKIVIAGDQFMWRDWDELRQEHIGGKVDIWVRSSSELEVQEQFAFRFLEGLNVPFTILDPINLVFEAQDANLSEDNPITELLSDVVLGWGFRNVTKGSDYNITGYQIGDPATYPTTWWKTVILDPVAPGQPVTDSGDVISGDYRYFATNEFTPSTQPVKRIVSVVGAVAGSLSSDEGYTLYKLNDPLFDGESTIAGDFIRINQVSGVPSGSPIITTDESHILIGESLEPLNNIGVNVSSVRVFTADRVTEFTLGTDFTVGDGGSTGPTYVKRLNTGAIVNGSQVSIDYRHDENFIITYVTNRTLQEVQRRVNLQRHVTADVLVKQSPEVRVNLDLTVVLRLGGRRSVVDSPIRTAIAREFAKRKGGEGIRQGDIADAIESSHPDVEYVVIPYRKMARDNDTWQVRDPVVSTTYQRLMSLEIGPAYVYIIDDALASYTTDGGGPDNIHHGVFQGGDELILADSLADVGSAGGQAWIIGKDGAIVSGYTDTTTLIADGFLSSSEQSAELLRRTANHIVVSFTAVPGDPDPPVPSDHTYSATYIVNGATGVQDIEVTPLQHVEPGTINIIYREIENTDESGVSPV
jgi:ribosomal protein S9